MAGSAILLLLSIAFIARASANGVVIEVTHLPESCEIKASDGNYVSVHYVGKLTDGTEFDSSYRSGEPIEFRLGAQQVIPGWEEGINGMCIGEKRRLEIPPHLGYGTEGMGPIPGGSTLVFDVELMRVSDEAQDNSGGYPAYDAYQNFGGENFMGGDDEDETLGEINFGNMEGFGDEDDGHAEWS